MRKYKCTFNCFIEDVIEAETEEEAEEEFYLKNDLSDLGFYLNIKQYRKLKKKGGKK